MMNVGSNSRGIELVNFLNNTLTQNKKKHEFK